MPLPEVLPRILAGEPVPMDKLRDLTEEGRFEKDEFERLNTAYATLSVGLQNALKEGRRIQKSMRESLRKLDRYFGALVIREPIQELQDKYEEIECVGDFLSSVEESILDSLARFVRPREEASEDDGSSAPQDLEMREYEVNLVVDNAQVVAHDQWGGDDTPDRHLHLSLVQRYTGGPC